MMYTTIVILYKNKGIQMGARFSTPVLYNGYRVSFPGVKRPERGVDHPPPSSAEVKERVQLYLKPPPPPTPLGLHGLFYGEIYLYLYLYIKIRVQ